ncbi:MAG: MFS transporter [Pseudobdellovibrionaceae bacterium]
MKLSYDVLKIRDFRLLLLTRILVMMALQGQAVIVGWQVYVLTGSPLLLGLTGLAEAIPAIFASLFAGHFVDIHSPRKIYRACFAALFINTLGLFLLAGGHVTVDESLTLIFIYVGIFISGLARSFITPSAFTLLPIAVKRRDIGAATSWLTSGFQMASIVGPALAGLIYGGYGVGVAWAFPMLLMFAAFMMAVAIRIDRAPDAQIEARPKAATSILEGWRFLLSNRTLLSLMALDMLAVLFGGAVAILPVFADQVLQTDAQGLGILRAAPAIGAVATALYFALKPMRYITARRMLIVVGGFGFSMIGFGLSTAFISAIIFLFLSGAFDSVSMVIRGTLMQLLIPEKMRGRVSAVNSMFVISSNEIGAFESGAAAAAIGLVPSIVLGGIGTVIVVGLTAILSPGFRKLRFDTHEDGV